MLSVADVARLAVAGADEMAHAIAAAGCARIWLNDRVWCLVDADDYGWASAHKWNPGWHTRTKWKIYPKRNVGPGRATVYLHREILLRASPIDAAGYHAHHRNSQSLDCRRANLEWVPAAVNAALRFKTIAIPPLEAIVARLASQAPAPAPF